MIANKSTDVLFQILKCIKEAKSKEVVRILEQILSNKDAQIQKYLLTVDPELAHKQLRLQLQNDQFYRLNEDQQELYTKQVDFICFLHRYYIVREKGQGDIVDQFKKFLGSCKYFLNEEHSAIFVYLTKLIVREYQRVIRQMKNLAKDAEAVKRASEASKSLEQLCVQIIQDLLREVNTKHILHFKLMVTNQQMKIYFTIFKFDRAAACDKIPNERDLLDISPKTDLVTYNYYKGRILIFSSKFYEAANHLQRVLNICPNTPKGNAISAQVLKYLIPINLFMGRYPNKEMIQAFKLQEYQSICDSVRQGDVKALQKAIDQHRGLWIKRSLLILMDQLKVLCYRNLCRKVWLINGKQRKIKLEQFVKAFQLSHPENQSPSIPEVCCIIANLIYLELIIGKIFQNNASDIRALTLSEDPFKKRPEEINWQN